MILITGTAGNLGMVISSHLLRTVPARQPALSHVRLAGRQVAIQAA